MRSVEGGGTAIVGGKSRAPVCIVVSLYELTTWRVMQYKDGIMARNQSSDDEKPNAKLLSLRDFPQDLYWRCKELAARRQCL